LGYAEADPKHDIEGYDALFKLMILSDLVFNRQPSWHTVERCGITDISTTDIDEAAMRGQKIKHIAAITNHGGKLTATVKPAAVGKAHPLYAVEGVDNAIHLETDLIGELTLTGPGAGAGPTASAMLEDFCTIWTEKPHPS